MSEYPLVTIITVNFNGRNITAELIESLQQISYPNYEIIVIDNGSKEEIDSLKIEFPEIILIKSPINLGFAGGNNLGIAKAKGKYLMFLNNDTEVEPDFLEPMVAEFEKNPKIGIASSKIVYFQPGDKKLIQFAGSNPINKYTMRGSTIGHMEQDSELFSKIMPTHLVHGASMMVPRHVIEVAGLMPDIYFLYYEEHDWCQAIQRHGYDTYYIGTSKVFHKESITVGINSPLKVYYLERGRVIYLRRNTFGIEKIASVLFYMFLAFPKNAIKYLMKGSKNSFPAYISACLWHLNRWDVSATPFLQDSINGEINIINDTKPQKLKQF